MMWSNVRGYAPSGNMGDAQSLANPPPLLVILRTTQPEQIGSKDCASGNPKTGYNKRRSKSERSPRAWSVPGGRLACGQMAAAGRGRVDVCRAAHQDQSD